MPSQLKQSEQLLSKINREIFITNPQDTKKLQSLRTLKKELQDRIQAAQPIPEEAVFYVSLPMGARMAEVQGQVAAKRLLELEQEISQIKVKLGDTKQMIALQNMHNERQALERQVKTAKFWPSVVSVTAPGTTGARWVRCPWDERENVAWFLDSIGASWQEVEE